MAKFYVSDVMERKADGLTVGYNIVITCEGDAGAKVDTSLFVASKDLPVGSKSSIATIAEDYLKQKNGLVTNADIMAEKAVVISEEKAESLIPDALLSVEAKEAVIEEK